MIKQLDENLKRISELSPLVHNITNYVVMNNTANALLAIGASPVMAHAIDEVEDMAKIASSLVLNIGTLSNTWVEAMKLAAKIAQNRGIPIILDPVGAGATPYRTATAKSIIKKCKPTIIRGNASEIMALIDTTVHTKGVDSVDRSDCALEAAKHLAKENNNIVVISGETDYITDGERVAKVKNGHKMMARVTGMGCTATAIIGAMAAVNKDAFAAALNGMTVMGITGEIAVKNSKGNGSLQVNFLDTLYNLNIEEIKEIIR